MTEILFLYCCVRHFYTAAFFSLLWMHRYWKGSLQQTTSDVRSQVIFIGFAGKVKAFLLTVAMPDVVPMLHHESSAWVMCLLLVLAIGVCCLLPPLNPIQFWRKSFMRFSMAWVLWALVIGSSPWETMQWTPERNISRDIFPKTLREDGCFESRA